MKLSMAGDAAKIEILLALQKITTNKIACQYAVKVFQPFLINYFYLIFFC